MSWRTINLGSIIVDELRKDFIRTALESTSPKESLLDVGCGNRPFQLLYEKHANLTIGIDRPSSPHNLDYVDVFACGEEIPFKEASFDFVLCTEVLEHVAEPEIALAEMHRVLKPSGILIMTTPFLVPLHEAPFDYYRYTAYGLTHLLRKAGFSKQSVRPFSEMIGVTLSFFVQVQLKFWRIPTKVFKISAFSTIMNPLVFLFVYLPQQLYVLFYHFLEKRHLLNPILLETSYTTKGYGIVAHKKK